MCYTDKMNDDITQERLKELLEYNPDTGIFKWKVSRRNTRKGATAGTVNHGYIRIQIDGKIYMAHRLAYLYMTGNFPEHQIDHDDRTRNNNKWLNINSATQSQNMQNRNDNNKVIGVYWHKEKEKYFALGIKVNGNSPWLGYYHEEWEAICVRKSWENNQINT